MKCNVLCLRRQGLNTRWNCYEQLYLWRVGINYSSKNTRAGSDARRVYFDVATLAVKHCHVYQGSGAAHVQEFLPHHRPAEAVHWFYPHTFFFIVPIHSLFIDSIHCPSSEYFRRAQVDADNVGGKARGVT